MNNPLILRPVNFIRTLLIIAPLACFWPLQAATFQVENAKDDGAGSLRQAILDANEASGVDEIHFNIPGNGPHTIKPATPLPAIGDPVSIDGYTQPGSSVNTLTNGSNAVLQIELNGELLTGRVSGLVVETFDSAIRGLAINRFPEYGIVLGKFPELGNDNHVVEGNYIGTSTDGMEALGNGSGIYCISTANGRLGGTEPASRNVISGNKFAGVSMVASMVTVQGNLIGTNAEATGALPNRDGIHLSTGGGFSIGGTVPGAGNIIAGNSETGIILAGTSVQAVQIKGNAIGTDFSGTTQFGNQLFGIQIHAGWNNVIGGDGPNIIAYHGSSAVRMSSPDARGNSVRGNRIFSNGWLAVQLVAPSGSESDSCDADFGPNGAQNAPQLTSGSWEAGQMALEGTLNSTADTTFVLDFYATTASGSGDYPAGEYYIGAGEVTTNAQCEGSFSIGLPVPTDIPAGTVFITATATDPAGNTSTYSATILEVSGGGVVVTDADGDGLPTDWEASHGLSDNDASGDNGPDGDPDGDSSSNLSEYLAGTDPNDSSSLLRITDIVRQGNDIRITWNTIGGRTNQLQVSTGLTEFVDLGPEITVPGAGDVSTDAIDAGAFINAQSRFYRVRTVR